MRYQDDRYGGGRGQYGAPNGREQHGGGYGGRGQYGDSYGGGNSGRYGGGRYGGGVDVERLNRKLIPYNIIIVLVSIACLISLLVGTTWKVSISMKINEEVASGILGSAMDSMGEIGEMNDMDLSVLNTLDPIKLELVLPASILLKSFQADEVEASKTLIASLTNSLLPQIGNIFKSLIKFMAVMVANTAVHEVLNATETAAEQNTGLTSIDLTGIDGVIEEMFEERPNIDKVKTDLKSILAREINKTDLTAEEKAEALSSMYSNVDESIDSMTEQFGDENGSINTHAVMYSVMGEALHVEGEEGKSYTPEELTAEFTNIMTRNLNTDMLRFIRYGLMGLAALFILIPALAWGLLALFATLRIFRKNKGAYLGFARAVGWMPFAVLVLMPTIGLLVAPKYLGENTDMFTGMFDMKFMSLSIVSFIGSIVLMLLSWFGYRKTKKQIKKAR